MKALSIEEAARLLEASEVVGMPTETVYGLAARIDRPEGLRKIFSTKERPFFDPLIVHVSSVNQAKSLTSSWSKASETLAKKFWPGPLTMVLPKASHVDPVITSGLESVGIRFPEHPVARELIEAAKTPLAAPSANRFGRTSPTEAFHVVQEFQGRVPVLEGGSSKIGIESTVLRIFELDGKIILNLLRPGSISLSQIEEVLRRENVAFTTETAIEKSAAPGQMKHHYMPDVPLIWVNRKQMDLAAVTAYVQKNLSALPDEVEGVKIKKPTGALQKAALFELEDDPVLAARALYSRLRERAASGADHLVYFHDPKRTGELWEGILDRLRKAAHLIIS